MDDAVTRLERARAAAPDDASVAVELARAYVRVGRPLRALAVLGPLDPGEREVAGRALASALGLQWIGVEEGTDRFVLDRPEWKPEMILVHAGAFLEDGEAGLVSSLADRLGRSDLRRVVVPAFLASVFAMADEPLNPERMSTRPSLPTPTQWKKLWRGGLFLDGDESQRVPNPEPDRLVPGTFAYGAHVGAGCELLRGGRLGGVVHDATGRYFVPLETPEQRRNRILVWRPVLELPRHP